ncbi:MAG: M24 family metallopeptidase, partial [Planctomycetota bacterium]
ASFETIVAAGAHAALPHYRPGRTRIRADQAVLIDWGAVVKGYCSDLTRVVFTGRIRGPIANVYEIVLRAQAAGIAAVSPRATCGSADAAARAVIDRAGYSKAFGHGLGHGVGLRVHEGPRLGRGVDRKLRPGMVVTVEPGIYLPGVGGVRIEDDVLVVPGGRRRLSSLARDIRAMMLR